MATVRSAKSSSPTDLGSPLLRYRLALGLAFLVIFIISYYSIDPDFGWHLASGNYFISFGLPARDIFSYTASSFAWINHEWLNDVIIASLYSLGGYALVACFFTIIWVAALYIASRLRLTLILLFATFALLPFVGIRPVAWSLLFVAILELIHEKANSKIYLTVPFIMLIWANLHGSFVFGLLLITLWQIFSDKRMPWAIFIASLLAVFLNPYGWRIFIEVFSTITDSSLKFRISEWAPVIIPVLPLSYLILFTAFHFLFSKKPWRDALSIPGLTLAMALSSIRHTPIFIVATLRYFEEYQIQLVRQLNRIKPAAKPRFLLFGFFAIFVVAVSILVVLRLRSATASHAYYPQKAVAYITKNPCTGNIFNSYNFGGYLIWQLPEYRYYIDGRMPSWKTANNDYFENYIKTLTNDEFRRAEFAKYNVSCVLLTSADNTRGKSRYIRLGDQLTKEGWQPIPSASTADYFLYTRP